MSSANADAEANKHGEFQPTKPRDEPLTTKGHAIGTKVGNDAVPEFHAQTLPAGSAPASNTFQPNPISEVPGQALNDNVLRSHGKESTHTTASSTLVGSTSADVHTGLGHPGQGQTAADNNKKGGGQGLMGVGASTLSNEMGGADERLDPKQRGIEREGVVGGAKDTVGETPSAAERIPEGAERVAVDSARP